MATLPTYELTIYEEDDMTVLLVVSTDPLHAQPYLRAPDGLAEQEVEFAKGAASIGQLNVQIVDVPTTPGDQDTGFFTGQLADPSGVSQINGHRAVLKEDLGSGLVIVLDGVVRTLRLLDNFVTYELELRDIRERERKTKAFATTTTPTLVPRGVLDGYGITFTVFGVVITNPVNPTRPLAGQYHQEAINRGWIQIADTFQHSDEAQEAMNHIAPLAAEPEVFVYDYWKVLWRDKAAGGAYTTVTQVAHTHSALPAGKGGMFDPRLLFIPTLWLNNPVSGDTLPADLQQIEFIVQYDGPVTSDWPFHLEGLTAGEVLRNLYRGDYSDEDPRIRYDETALLALKTPVRMRLGEPVDNIREWAEKNIYPIVHAAPTLNPVGEISPITYLLPDASVTLVALDDTNCRPSGGGWSQASEDAVNVVKVTYKRDYAAVPAGLLEVTAIPDELLQIALSGIGSSDLIHTRDVIIEHRNQASIDLLGEQELTIKSELLRTIGSVDGGPLFGDVTDETGARVAERITRMATDRFVLGGQYFALLSDRSDSEVEGLKGGSWVTVGVSWMPDYLLGLRGLSRLAQVISRRNLNAAWTSLTLIDAGSANAPLLPPTLGTITADSVGVVSIPVTALGAGSEARLEYAVNATEPAADSELWTFLKRVPSVPVTETTPPLPPNVTAWVRARGEALGRRPSVYTTAVSVVTPSTPRVVSVSITMDADGIPTVTWVPNIFCLGVRVHYEVHDITAAPTFPDNVEADASDLSVMISSVVAAVPQAFSVEVEPFPGWTGSAVSGSPGPIVAATVIGSTTVLPDFAMRALLDGLFAAIPEIDGNVAVKSARIAFVKGAPPLTEPTDAAVRARSTVDGTKISAAAAVAGYSDIPVSLAAGEACLFKAFVYSGAAGGGQESALPVTAFISREIAAVYVNLTAGEYTISTNPADSNASFVDDVSDAGFRIQDSVEPGSLLGVVDGDFRIVFAPGVP